MTQKNSMTAKERYAVLGLSSIFAFRMLGLFMILPVFSLYGPSLTGATPALIGLAIGIYGFSQACLQIPFGMLSDRFGRKPIITLGLFIFVIGSVLAATSHSITGVIVGRAIQGAGAVGSTVMAMVADLTRIEHRTQAMALIGITIGLSFSVAMVLGPLCEQWIGVPGIFWLTAFMGITGIVLLWCAIPTPRHGQFHPDAQLETSQLSSLLKHRELWRLNIGMFTLHAILTANFVVLPLLIRKMDPSLAHSQWQLYLPVILLSFLIMLPCVIFAEKKHHLKFLFLGSIIAIFCTELGLWQWHPSVVYMGLLLLLFFTAFSVLEAILPSLTSKIAPASRKGTALGMMGCAQFFGIFTGGSVAGWIQGHAGLTYVFLFCILLTACWLGIAIRMHAPLTPR